MMKNQLVRNRGGSLLKNIHNIEESNDMLLKFTYYDAISIRIHVPCVINLIALHMRYINTEVSLH